MKIFFNDINDFKDSKTFGEYLYENFIDWFNEENNKRLTKFGKISSFFATKDNGHISFGDIQVIFNDFELASKRMFMTAEVSKKYFNLEEVLKETINNCIGYTINNCKEMNLKMEMQPTGGLATEYIFKRV